MKRTAVTIRKQLMGHCGRDGETCMAICKKPGKGLHQETQIALQRNAAPAFGHRERQRAIRNDEVYWILTGHSVNIGADPATETLAPLAFEYILQGKSVLTA